MAVLSLRKAAPSGFHFNSAVSCSFTVSRWGPAVQPCGPADAGLLLSLPNCPMREAYCASQITHVLLADPACCSQSVHLLKDLDAAEWPHP